MPTYANDTKNDASREAKMAEYEKVKKDLKELISKKRGVDKSLVSIEINKIMLAARTNIYFTGRTRSRSNYTSLRVHTWKILLVEML